MDVVDVTLRVTEALERCGVAYFLGGSLASSFHGEPRATNDVDLVVDLTEAKVEPLLAALGPDFDGDEAALREAVRERGSWNAIYVPAVTKIDVFVRGTSAFDESEFRRGQRVEVRPGKTLVVKSPEDTVLRKLIWHRGGSAQSGRQWRDVVEVLRQSRDVMENAYLDAWAGALGIAELLVQAREEAAR
jgi:hypothetical protein